ncbi:MAG: glucuronate isomerase [Bacteroidaceae bacterium]
MKPFMDKDFLLDTRTAQVLYHEEAASLPIIDFHCHLSPKEIAEDHKFRSITELWLGGDHYKWRALRANGVDERYITGEASDWEKFEKWACTMPYCMRNPLYHWTHLELRTAFGIQDILKDETAKRIYERCNEMLTQPEYSARGLMRRYHVEVVCTTDDPADSLQYHQSIRDSGFEIKVLPTWRPDKALAIDKPQEYLAYIRRLGEAADVEIDSYPTLVDALQRRHDFFEKQGCRLSDHGISRFPWSPYSEAQANTILKKVLGGKEASESESEQFSTALLLELARMDARSGWTQQFHYGPMRNNNTRMFRLLGPDTGYDSIGTQDTSASMARFLDALDSENMLAQTILYCINPSDNEMLATMIGNFQQGPQPGKIQFGSGWWFNDQLDGMERQMNALSMQGLLSRFVGMLTDSRSFLSYPRHEYFRRCLCRTIGRDVEMGLLPASEMPFIRKMIRDISYYNAKRYFHF